MQWGMQVAIQQRQDIKNAYVHSINDLEAKTNALKKAAGNEI